MSWGGNRTGELSKRDYEDKIRKMTGIKAISIFRKLNKRELRQLKEAIEEARYRAIDEYKKEVTKLEQSIKEIIKNLELIINVTPDYVQGRRRGLTDDETEKLAYKAVYEAIEVLEKLVEYKQL